MKKTSVKKAAPVKKSATPVKTRITPVTTKPSTSGWSLSIYIYWIIILFFVAATFYILGRSQAPAHMPANNVEITEEALLQSDDYYQSGKTKLMSGDLETAIKDLTAAITAAENNADAYILRGEAYMQSGDYDAAMADFNKVIEMDSKNSVAYYDRALLYTRMENYNAALVDINNTMAARVENPNNVLQMRDLYARRGQLNLWLKNWQGAIADYTNSLALPDGIVSPSVYGERAEAYTATGDYESAINDYSSAVRVISEQIKGATSSDERETLSSRAMSYFEKSAALNVNLGNMDAARVDLESAITIAIALNDADTVNRLQTLVADMENGQLDLTITPDVAPQPQPVPEPVVDTMPGENPETEM